MNAEGIEVRNCFWLRTGTPLSGSCISRTNPSICARDRHDEQLLLRSIRIPKRHLVIATFSGIAIRKRFICVRENNVPCRRRKACECVAPSLFVVEKPPSRARRPSASLAGAVSISMAEGAGELGRRRVYPNSMGLWPHPITPVTPARPLKHSVKLFFFHLLHSLCFNITDIDITEYI